MCLINANQKIMIIRNTQITNILTNTKDSDNHGTKYKHFPQFPGEEISRKCTVSAEPWANRRHLPPSHLSPPSPPPPPQKKNIYTYIFPNGKPGENSLFCAMNKYILYINNLKKCKMHIISFFFKYIYILLKSDVNQMKPT